MKARRSKITILCDHVDISLEINKNLRSFDISNSTNEIDSLEIELANINNFWISSWRPLKGLKLEALYTLINWDTEKETIMKIGTFYIDSISFSGPPDVCKIKALSIPIESKLLDQNQSKVWLNTDLETIVKEIATDNGLELKYLVNFKREYVRIEQKLESQFNFLKKICNPIGLLVKIFDGKLIIFEEETIKNTEPSLVLTKGDILSYSLSDSDVDTYAGCEITWYDGERDTPHRATFYTKKRTGYKKNTSRLLKVEINDAPGGETADEIKANLSKLAEKYLKVKNEKTITGRMSILGRENKIYELSPFLLIGFGEFDGKYLIKKLDTNYINYTLDIEFVKIENEGDEEK